MTTNTTTKKLTLKSLLARVEELENRIQELEANQGRSKSQKDTGVSFVREVTPQVVSYKLTTYIGKAVYALGYHMKDRLATYSYQKDGNVINVSPEEAGDFEEALRAFFSGNPEKGYKARKVEIQDGSIAEAIKAMKSNKAA